MTDEQFENRMEFVVNQLAKCATDIDRLTETQARLTEAQSRTDSMIRNLVDVSLSLANHLQETDERFDERINRLAERQERSEDRLDGLIEIVDKLIRRDGGATLPS